MEFENGHSVNIPLDERAGGILQRILLAQAAPSPSGHLLATPARPLQSMVDAWLARGGKVTKPAAANGSISIDIDELFPEEV